MTFAVDDRVRKCAALAQDSMLLAKLATGGEWVSSFLTAYQHIIGYSVPQMVDSKRMSM